MKPKFELTIRMYESGMEVRANGKLDRVDRFVLFDQLANRLLRPSERPVVGRFISNGGVEKMVGESYSTTYQIDPNLEKTLKKYKDGQK